jgi:hypothetical protein
MSTRLQKAVNAWDFELAYNSQSLLVVFVSHLHQYAIRDDGNERWCSPPRIGTASYIIDYTSFPWFIG